MAYRSAQTRNAIVILPSVHHSRSVTIKTMISTALRSSSTRPHLEFSMAVSFQISSFCFRSSSNTWNPGPGYMYRLSSYRILTEIFQPRMPNKQYVEEHLVIENLDDHDKDLGHIERSAFN